MDNTVTIDSDGLVHIRLQGNQTGNSVREVNRQAQELVTAHGLTNPDFLVDISTAGKSDSESRKVGSQMLKTFAYRRIALFGAKGLIKQVTALVLRGSGKSSKVKQFGTVAEAKRWLAEDA